jgi:hypothetical protein
MDDVLPFGWSIYKVQFPHPIIYTFNPTGLFCFVWAKDFDREYGKFESNRRPVITRCDSLRIDDGQREPARLTEEHYLSINERTVWQILSHHAMTEPDRSFETDDMKLFFDNQTNALNQADQWIENLTDRLIRDFPQKRRHRS